MHRILFWLPLIAAFASAAHPGEARPVSAQWAEEAASQYLEREQYDQVLVLVDKGLRGNPRHMPLWLLKARAHLARGEYEGAAEAVGVCLAADPGDTEYFDLAFRIHLSRPDTPSEMRQDRLAELINQGGPPALSRVLGKWIMEGGAFLRNIDALLSAWEASELSPAPERKLLLLIRKDRIDDAVSLLHTLEERKEYGTVRDGLRFLLGRLLALNGRSESALVILEPLLQKGFFPGHIAPLIALCHRETGNPGAAANVARPHWRQCADPGRAVSLIADDYLAAGLQPEALAILDESHAAFGRLPAHRAKRALAAAENLQEIDKAGFPVAAGYARALAARHEENHETAEKEFANLRRYVRETLAIPLDRDTVEVWLEFGHNPGHDRRLDELDGRFAVARQLWDEGMRTAAVMLWSDTLLDGPASARTRAMEIVTLLAENGMGSQAIALLKRHLPELRLVDIAAGFHAQERWAALTAVMQDAGLGEASDGRGWLTLYRCLAALIAEDDNAAAQALQLLAGRIPQIQPLAVRRIEDNDSIGISILPASVYQDIMRDAVSRVVHRDSDTLYDIILNSPQWRDDADFGIVRFSEQLLRAGKRDAARRFFEVMQAEETPHPYSGLGLALLELRDNRFTAAARYATAAVETADGVVRERLLALLAQLNHDGEKQALHLVAALRIQEEDHELRLEAIRALTALHRYKEAAELAEFYESYRIRGEMDVVFHLAHARVNLGHFEKAAEHWRTLRRRYPQSQPVLAGLGRTLNQMNRPEETIAELRDSAEANPTAELTALMAEAHLALGNYRETFGWAEAGLVLEPRNLRLLGSAVRACEGLQWHAGIEKYTGRYIRIDPYSSTMQLMHGQSLVDQEKWREVYQHNLWILDRNIYNWAALERELERRNAQVKNPWCSWVADRYIAEHFDNNPQHVLRIGIRAAGLGKYHRDYYNAFPALERLFDYGPNASALTLYYSSLTAGRRLGSVQLDTLRSHMEAISGAYRSSGTEALRLLPDPDEYPRPVPLVLVLGRMTPADLRATDDYLRQIDAKAVLIVGEESLSNGTPMWADIDMLREIAANGRWEFVLTDYSPSRQHGAADGEWTEFWTQRKWLGDRRESAEEMNKRLLAELMRLRGKAEAAGICPSGWVHPSWGDYGQRVILGDVEAMRAYLAAVGEVFPLAFTHTPGGFTVPDTDPLRIPMRTVGDAIDPFELRTALQYAHPTRRAALELAKVKSWNGQFSEANRLFNTARAYGANPQEISYFQTRNSQYAGDVACAVALSHEARWMDPENSRTHRAVRHTHRLLRPILTPGIRHWSDSNHEKYTETTATLSFHVNPKWELRVLAGYHRWDHPDKKEFNGTSGGFGVRHYFKPENWWLAEVRGVAVGGGASSFPEARLAWHGGFDLMRWRTNGTFDIGYHREGIETRDAIAAGIRANRFTVDTNFRVRDVWDIDFNSYFINRTDNNDTWGTMFRPTYRFREIPQLRVGYWFALADSDRNPHEYYAPVGYQAHQAVAMLRHEFNKCWSVRGLASWGRAKTRSSDWRNVLRANAGFTYRPNDCISVTAGYNHLKLPDYTLNSYTMSVGFRF